MLFRCRSLLTCFRGFVYVLQWTDITVLFRWPLIYKLFLVIRLQQQKKVVRSRYNTDKIN